MELKINVVVKIVLLAAIIMFPFKSFSQLKEGDKAPEIVLNTMEGKEVKLSDFRGKTVLIDFWASWCAPCRKSNPKLEKMYQEFKLKGFEIIGVSLDSKKTSWENAVKKDKVTFTQVNDTNFWNAKSAQDYNVEALPASFLVDKNGIIIKINPLEEDVVKVLED